MPRLPPGELYLADGTRARNATHLRGRLLDDSALADGRVPVYRSATDTFEMEDQSGGGGGGIGAGLFTQEWNYTPNMEASGSNFFTNCNGSGGGVALVENEGDGVYQRNTGTDGRIYVSACQYRYITGSFTQRVKADNGSDFSLIRTWYGFSTNNSTPAGSATPPNNSILLRIGSPDGDTSLQFFCVDNAGGGSVTPIDTGVAWPAGSGASMPAWEIEWDLSTPGQVTVKIDGSTVVSGHSANFPLNTTKPSFGAWGRRTSGGGALGVRCFGMRGEWRG